jgi:hypothetical protein
MTEALSPFSCLSCRLSKRKCDRILPACHGCSAKHKICQYEKPTKRGRKPKSTLYMPYTVHKPAESIIVPTIQNYQQIANNVNMKQVVPLPPSCAMSPEQYEAVFQYIWNDTSNPKPSDEHIAVVCGVQGTSNQKIF